eukprot:m.51408 g.51408  ORF g.51408 m.51408 type:complete len:72 (+) comp10733_c0_seq1:1583-1798(+)
MSSSCEFLREKVKDCLSRSECMVKYGKPAKDCARLTEEHTSEECKATIRSLFVCKRGQLDARQRFRGSKDF